MAEWDFLVTSNSDLLRKIQKRNPNFKKDFCKYETEIFEANLYVLCHYSFNSENNSLCVKIHPTYLSTNDINSDSNFTGDYTEIFLPEENIYTKIKNEFLDNTNIFKKFIYLFIKQFLFNNEQINIIDMTNKKYNKIIQNKTKIECKLLKSKKNITLIISK